MTTAFGISRRAMLLPALLATTAAVGLAQMGGMRGSGATTGISLGGMMGGSLYGMMGGGTGLTIEPDGTPYITRSAQTQGQSVQTATTQLAALDVNGSVKWSLPSIAVAPRSRPSARTERSL